MTPETLEAAITEAKRFIEAAQKVKTLESGWIDSPSKDCSAAKRASMDLSRALSAMRRR